MVPSTQSPKRAQTQPHNLKRSPSQARTHAVQHSGPRSGQAPVRLAVAAVSELSVFSYLQFGGVGGGDAVAGLHAVALLQLGEGAHEAGVGRIKGCDALLLKLRTETQNKMFT